MTRPVATRIPISFAYGKRYRNGIIHKGIDYSDGREGHDVVSMLPGVVIHAGYGGWGPAYGQHVVIRSGASVLGKVRYTLLGHLKTENVKVGQLVKAGQKVGTSGGRKGMRYSGNSTGPHVHAQLGSQNRYDRYLNPAPAIARRATKKVEVKERWFGALAWNLAASDGAHGRDSWPDRLPGIRKAIKHYGRDVLMLVDACTPAQLPKFEAALARIGYKVAVYEAGRCIAVRKSVKVGRTKTFTLDEKGPKKDDRQIVLAEVFPGKGTAASLVEVGLFEHRDGPRFDTARVAQAKQTRRVIEHMCKAWSIPLDRVVAYNDESSRSLVSKAFGPTWPDLVRHAPAYGNKTYTTLVSWRGSTTKKGYRPDKVRTHKSRPVIGGSTSLTFADDGLSNHLPVVVTLGRF